VQGTFGPFGYAFNHPLNLAERRFNTQSPLFAVGFDGPGPDFTANINDVRRITQLCQLLR